MQRFARIGGLPVHQQGGIDVGAGIEAEGAQPFLDAPKVLLDRGGPNPGDQRLLVHEVRHGPERALKRIGLPAQGAVVRLQGDAAPDDGRQGVRVRRVFVRQRRRGQPPQWGLQVLEQTLLVADPGVGLGEILVTGALTARVGLVGRQEVVQQQRFVGSVPPVVPVARVLEHLHAVHLPVDLVYFAQHDAVAARTVVVDGARAPEGADVQ